MEPRFTRAFAATAAAALALGLSAGGSAAAAQTTGATLAPGTYSYDTYLTPEYFGAGSYEGDLRLNVGQDGSINGVFRNLDVGNFRTVTGGEDGKNVWLDLGGTATPIVNLHLEHGKLVGGIYSGDQPYSFVASPKADHSL